MKSILLTILVFFYSTMSSQAFSADLKLVFSKYTPPYVFEDGTGIVVDIVRTALADSGYKIQPAYLPIERGFKMFSERQVDGTTIIQESSGLKAEYSDDFMQYHNRAFALKSRNLVIRSVADLGDKSVAAFQNANKYLGGDFARVVAKNRQYREMAQQEAQAQMLFLGRVDVVVMDESIFLYYRQKLMAAHKVGPAQEVIGYDIFPPTPYKAAFIDPKIRNDFNKGIAAMRKDGRYEAIYHKYTEQYFQVRQ